ncbi:MAG: tripartite tricarboxylate transporter TctB family protein [Microvirga sp.]|nr:tripartite tricarboxylate transporter TctB family protein [Microvirga sp.]
MNLSRITSRDVVGGLILLVVGVSIALYAVTLYPLGDLAQPGPGFFPLALGCVLSAFGVLIAVSGMLQAHVKLAMDVAPFLLVVASLASFALTVDHVGIVPAIMLMTIVSAFATPNRNVLETLLLAAILAASAAVIFTVLLGLPFTLIRWPMS